MSSALLGFIIPALTDIQSTRYSELASSAIIIYDHIITLDQEIQLIWNTSWSLGKFLFILNRYYAFFTVLFNNYALFSPNLTDELYVLGICSGATSDFLCSCLSWFRWQGWTGLIACAIAEIILQVRIYALYYRNKKVLVLMVGFFISAMASSAAIMGTVLKNISARAHLVPTATFCVGLNVSRHFYAFWIPILCFETLLCSLALHRGYRSYREQELRARMRRKRLQGVGDTAEGKTVVKLQVCVDAESDSGPSILEILLRDSIIFFIIMFAAYFTTTMIWILGRTTVIEIPVGYTVAMSCVVGNRLLLNIRSSQQHRYSVNLYRANTSAAHMSTVGSGQLQSMDLNSSMEARIGSHLAVAGEYELHALRTLKPHT